MNQLTPSEARLRFRERLVFTLGLRRKPIRLFCEHCGKFIPSDMPWVCGYCDCQNERNNRFSFLHKCERCKRPPNSLTCPHCSEAIYFGQNKDGLHPARGIAPVKIDGFEEIESAKKHEKRKTTYIRRIELARLDAEFTSLKKSLTPSKEESEHESLEKDFAKHDARTMAVHRILKREKESNAKRYADDDDMRKMADDSVQDWAMGKIGKPS
jgi:hypothetical protein